MGHDLLAALKGQLWLSGGEEAEERARRREPGSNFSGSGEKQSVGQIEKRQEGRGRFGICAEGQLQVHNWICLWTELGV